MLCCDVTEQSPDEIGEVTDVFLNLNSLPLTGCFFFCRYESLVGSMKKKFAKKRQRSATEEEEDVNHNVVETNTKRVFLKPQD